MTIVIIGMAIMVAIVTVLNYAPWTPDEDENFPDDEVDKPTDL